MKTARNQNRPQKGDQIKVGPIKKRKDIDSIKKLLGDDPRNSALFTIGINTNLRASDLLRIKVVQVRDLKRGDEIELKERKTGKPRRITLNKACVQAIQRLLASRPCADEDLLFTGQRGPLTVPSVHRLVKSWSCNKSQRKLRKPYTEEDVRISSTGDLWYRHSSSDGGF